MEYINADLSNPLARVSYEEMARWSRGAELIAKLEADLAAGVIIDDFEEGSMMGWPTTEQTAAERDAAGYGQDNRVLCIEPDTTDDGTVIPEWAFI